MNRLQRMLGALALTGLSAGAASALDVQQRLDMLKANVGVDVQNTDRPLQTNIGLNRFGQPAIEAIITQYVNGTLSNDPAAYPRHLSVTGTPITGNQRDPAVDRGFYTAFMVDINESDLATNLGQPYLGISIYGSGGIDPYLNGLTQATGAAALMHHGLTPDYVGLLEAIDTGMTTFDESVTGQNGLVKTLYLVALKDGAQCYANATLRHTGGGHHFLLDLAPYSGCGGIANPGNVKLDLDIDEVGGVPVQAVLTRNAASDLDPSIDAIVQLCPRGQKGTLIDPADCDTFDYSSGQQTLGFDIWKYTDLPGSSLIFGDGLETGNLDRWSNHQP